VVDDVQAHGVHRSGASNATSNRHLRWWFSTPCSATIESWAASSAVR